MPSARRAIRRPIADTGWGRPPRNLSSDKKAGGGEAEAEKEAAEAKAPLAGARRSSVMLGAFSWPLREKRRRTKTRRPVDSDCAWAWS